MTTVDRRAGGSKLFAAQDDNEGKDLLIRRVAHNMTCARSVIDEAKS
jgi:hypothetical protein